MKISVVCRKCKTPKDIELPPETQILEGWLTMFCCDPCMRRMGRLPAMKPSAAAQREESRKPYSD